MRNILAKVSQKFKGNIGADLSLIFKQDSVDKALNYAHSVMAKYGDKFSKAMDCLSEDIHDAIQFLNCSELPTGRKSSTNYLERLNHEIRRRSKVVTIFPSVD